MKILQILQNFVSEKFDVYEKFLRTQNSRHRFIKNLLPEKRKKTRKPNNYDLNCE